jgi:prepilin-type N-terminal cleavage/methylation domain-containing protein
MNIKLKEDKGFTLVEVIIAISILTFGILAVGAMQGAALRGDSFAYNRTEASTWAQDKMEQLMSVPFASMTNGNQPRGNFNITWNITPLTGLAANTSRIDVVVTYFGLERARLTANRSSLFE